MISSKLLLTAAAVLAVGIAAAHSMLGERYIIVRLLRRDNLPELFGSDVFTKRTLRYAWHATTIAWCGFAALLLILGGVFPGIKVAQGVLLAIAMTFAATGAMALVASRGRHLSWVVFLTMAVLCWLALM